MTDNLAHDTQGGAVPLLGRNAATDGASSSSCATSPTCRRALPPLRAAADARKRELPAIVGARPWARDALDARVLADMARGTGKIIDSEVENALGYPRHAPTRRVFKPEDWNLDDMSPKGRLACPHARPDHEEAPGPARPSPRAVRSSGRLCPCMADPARSRGLPRPSGETTANVATGPRLILVGDSTMAPRSGYGNALCARFQQVACINLARGGRSSKSFRAEGLWDDRAGAAERRHQHGRRPWC